jgi:Zn-finger nucleic acid-binding protein
VPYWFRRIKQPSRETDFEIEVEPISGAKHLRKTDEDCPGCGAKLDLYSLLGIEFEGCPKCHGLWVDRDELRKLKNKIGIGELHWLNSEVDNIEQAAAIASKRVCPRKDNGNLLSVVFGKSSDMQTSPDGRTIAERLIGSTQVVEKGSKEMNNQQFRNLTGAFAVAALIFGLVACATETGNVADNTIGPALLAAGFKVRPATIPEQRSHINTLPDNRFTMVKENGNPYYLYADKKNGKLFVGNRFAYQAYINNIKNNELRKQGAFVWEVNPSDRALNRTIVVWHGWGPFEEW